MLLNNSYKALYTPLLLDWLRHAAAAPKQNERKLIRSGQVRSTLASSQKGQPYVLL